MPYILNSNKLNRFEKLLSILFILIPIFLITGPFLSDLALSIIACYFFFNFKKIKIIKNKFFYLFILFYLTVLFNSFNFDYYLYSLKSFFFYFRFLLFIFVVSYLINLEKRIIDDLLKVIIICIAIVFIFGFYEYLQIRLEYFSRISQILSIDALNYIKNTTPQRVSGIFGDEKIMGTYMMRIFPLFLITYFISLKDKELSKKNLITIFLVSSIVGSSIIISADRAPLILFCFQLVLFFFLIKEIRKTFFYLGSIILILFSLIIVNDPISKERIINVTVDNFSGQYNEKKFTLISRAYEGHFNAAVIIFKKYPILGSGIKGYRNQCYKLNENYSGKKYIECTTHPHNIFFHIISESGLIGIFIYFYLFYFVLKKLFLSQRSEERINSDYNFINTSIKICMINFLIILWPITTSGSFFNNYNNIFYCLPLALYVSINKNLFKNIN